jgi:NADP-dependent 3-hydroxy acid dehydrogenase YdfG
MRRNILITGASAGLGAGMAREFAARGRNLALCARRTDRLNELRDELTRPGITVAIRTLDVTDHDAVFTAFRELRDELGTLDRVIVNAGRSKGRPVGTGDFEANRQIAETNFTAALAQTEAAMEIFRAQRSGHLVMISSIAAMRGFPRSLATYAATKAGITALAEGLRVETIGEPIEVSTIFPGYIRSEMNEHRTRAPFMVDTGKGCRLLVRAIEREPARAAVPAWPWRPVGFAMRHLPLRAVARMAARIT